MDTYTTKPNERNTQKHMYMYVHVFIHMYVYVYIYTYMHVYMYTRAHICVYIYARETYTHEHISTKQTDNALIETLWVWGGYD